MDRERVYKIPGLSDRSCINQPREAKLETTKLMAWCDPLPEWNAKILRVKSYFRQERSTYVLQNIKTYVLRCTTIGFKQKYGHRSSRRADINLRYKCEFTVEIGQYFVGRRSWDCVIWHHSCSYFYAILCKNTWSFHRIEDVAVFLLLMSLKWLHNQGNLSTAWCNGVCHSGMASLRQANVGNDMKNILYLWFSHFTLTETHWC